LNNEFIRCLRAPFLIFIEKNELILHYQPKVDMASGQDGIIQSMGIYPADKLLYLVIKGW
jgi:hypothetical protein